MKIYRDDTAYETTSTFGKNITIGYHIADTKYKMDIDNLTEYEIVCLSAFVQTANEKNISDYISIGEYYENRVCISKQNNIWETYIGAENKAYGSESFDNCYEACMAAIDKISGNKEDNKDLIYCFSNHINNSNYEDNLKILKKENHV